MLFEEKEERKALTPGYKNGINVRSDTGCLDSNL